MESTSTVEDKTDLDKIEIVGDCCEASRLFDNKVMVNTAHPERPIQQAVCLNVPDSDNPQSKSKRKKISAKFLARIDIPFMSNGIILVIVCSLLFLLELGYIPGTKLGFVCNDPLISHKYTGDTISPTSLLIGSAFGPLVVIILIELIRLRSLSKVTIGTVWFYYKECFIGALLTLLITEVMKIIVGEHRPHFLDVCEPDTNIGCSPGTYIPAYKCTSTRFSQYFLIDTSRSFPSGHSSISVFVALYCSFLIQSRIPTIRTGRLFKPFLISVCLSWGCLCSLSRIVDRRHHWWDVLAGSILGALFALYTIHLVRRQSKEIRSPPRMSTSTTTLLDVKNKDATSVII